MPRAVDYDGDESCSTTVDRASGKGVSVLGIKARNWLITQNNADKYGVDMSRDAILQLLAPLIGKDRIAAIAHIREQSLLTDDSNSNHHTLHDHLAIRIPNQAYGGQLYKYFPHAALLPCNADFSSIVSYIRKDTSGLWYKTHPEKLGERLPPDQANYWQWGDVPTGADHHADHQKKTDNLNAQIMEAIIAGKTDAEIMMAYPYAWRRPAELRKVRYAVMSQRYRSVYRDLKVIYIQANMPPKQIHTLFAATRDTYVVSDYTHPWDSYSAETTVVLLDFCGQVAWPELRRLMSGNYCTLQARFSDAVACYVNLLIVSPLSPEGLRDCKSYEDNRLIDYLTNIRIYNDLDDYGTDYIRDAETGNWRQQYLLPPTKKE